MRGGTKALWLTTMLALASGCVSEGQLNVRAIPDPLAEAARKGSPLVVEARARLALGNVGLALEAFRKAHRMQPDSIEALAGIAECYDRMGRHDLSRASYEAALAVAPNNIALLNTFAASLERQGRRSEAASLRAEAAQTETAAVESAASNLVVEAVGNTTWHIETTPAQPAAPALAARSAPTASTTVALPAPRPAPARAERATLPAPSRLVQASREPAPARSVQPIKVPVPAPVAPTPALPASTPTAVAVAAAVPAPLVKPAAAPPRLQRLSHGEVALLTGSGPAWRTEVVAQTQQSVTVRFVPLRTASARPNIRLLNAARRQGLAARTRSVLLDRGWRRIEIADAPQVRDRSVVLYPATRKALGLRLAAQFGFRSEVSARDEGLVVLLGRDATVAPALRRRG